MTEKKGIKSRKDLQNTRRDMQLFVALQLMVYGFLFYSILKPEINRGTGVVIGCDKNEIYIKGIKDSYAYRSFVYDTAMIGLNKQAFSRIMPGDTLTYIQSQNSPSTFSDVRKVNAKSLDEFVKLRNNHRVR